MKDMYKYDRVTSVLYPFTNLDMIDQSILRNAADRGNAVHSICDSLSLNHGKMDLEDIVKAYCQNDFHFEKEKLLVNKMVESFEKWSKDKVFLTKPERFFDDEHMITGECDLIYINDVGKFTLVDLKTPASESKTWLLQGSAYSYMANRSGLKIDKIEFVQLSRRGADPTVYSYVEDFNLFKSALIMYRYFFKGVDSPSEVDYI